ncbi:MAG TPA: UbiA family prenyltransferase [Chloroflexi bacterium]|jgi:4-hydroxybenzoate polyprenyltransferase|nr:UbiA family prenyltransferase [Chloroflexota bacterium]
MNALTFVARVTRWRDWGPGKVPVLCSIVFYILLAERALSPARLRDAALFILFAALHSAFGYMINDWGDRDLDRAHGKPNALADMRPRHSLLVLTITGGLALLSGLPFASRPWVLPLWIAWAFTAPAYSLKPLRLKERGKMGLLFSFGAQWCLPVLLAFTALGRLGTWDIALFVPAYSAGGATLEIAHQRHDRARDRSTATGTWGARASSDSVERLLHIALWLDRLGLGMVVLAIAWNLPILQIGRWAIPTGLPPVLIYSVLLFLVIHGTQSAGEGQEVVDPYYSTERTPATLLHETLPNLVIPTYLLGVATLYQPLVGIMLCAFLAWRIILGQADWRWPLRALRAAYPLKRE